MSRLVVNSALAVAGGMLALAMMTLNRTEKTLCGAMRDGRDAVDDAGRRVRGAVRKGVRSSQQAAEDVEEWADETVAEVRDRADESMERAEARAEDIIESASEQVESLREAVEDELDDEPDRRPYEERTREELYALAQERDIAGRSTMKKGELIAALRDERA